MEKLVASWTYLSAEIGNWLGRDPVSELLRRIAGSANGPMAGPSRVALLGVLVPLEPERNGH